MIWQRGCQTPTWPPAITDLPTLTKPSLAFMIGFFAMLAILGWHADAGHRHRPPVAVDAPNASVTSAVALPTPRIDADRIETARGAPSEELVRERRIGV